MNIPFINTWNEKDFRVEWNEKCLYCKLSLSKTVKTTGIL